MLSPSDSAFIAVISKPVVFSALLGFILAFGYSLQGNGRYRDKLKKNILPALGYAIPVGLVAYISGYLTGISRSPAVGSTVPAVLALLGGLNIYFFGSDSPNRAVVGYSLFVFSVLFFYAVWGGVDDREFGRVDRFIQLSEQERTIRNYRQNRGLPPDPASWILGGEESGSK
jgi:hypothetical protein